jgi:hypothetical protein
MDLERVMTFATEAASWPETGAEVEEVEDGLARRVVTTIVTRASANDSAEVQALLQGLAASVDRRALAQERWDRSLARERELDKTRGQANTVWGVVIALCGLGLIPFTGLDIIPLVLLPNVKNLLAPLFAQLTERAGQKCWRLDGEIRHHLTELATRVAPETSWLDPPPDSDNS